MNSPCFKLLRSYSILLNLSNVGKFFWSSIQNDCMKVQKKQKKVVVMCSRGLQNLKLCIFTLLSCSDGEEMNQKAWCTCKDVVLLISVNQLLSRRSRCRRRCRIVRSLLSNSAGNLPRTQTSLSLTLDENLGAREGKESLLLLLLPMVPCASSPVICVSHSPASEIRSAWGETEFALGN